MIKNQTQKHNIIYITAVKIKIALKIFIVIEYPYNYLNKVLSISL